MYDVVVIGGGWVHWHQPHTWSEITRAELEVAVSDNAQVAGWYVGDDRRTGTIDERDAIAQRGVAFLVFTLLNRRTASTEVSALRELSGIEAT